MQYKYFTDGITKMRDGIRDGNYVIDLALTPMGFTGTENVDWENLVS